MVHHLVVEPAREQERGPAAVTVVLRGARLHLRPVLVHLAVRHRLKFHFLRDVVRLERDGEVVAANHLSNDVAQQHVLHADVEVQGQHNLPHHKQKLAHPEPGHGLKAHGRHADAVPLLGHDEGKVLHAMAVAQQRVRQRCPDVLVAMIPLPLHILGEAQWEGPHVGVDAVRVAVEVVPEHVLMQPAVIGGAVEHVVAQHPAQVPQPGLVAPGAVGGVVHGLHPHQRARRTSEHREKHCRQRGACERGRQEHRAQG
mmetsp:Transcript_35743/g.68571  ORF Transcript_35743/g.68571 Transcript_35743/m.68571 type:complete len:256 (+) Transcript_35743:493-1260(+)